MKPKNLNLAAGRLGSLSFTQPGAPVAKRPTNYGVQRLGIASGQPLAPPVRPAARPVVRPKPPAPSPGDVTVCVTRTGRKYHRAGCRYLRRSSIPMKLKDAKSCDGPCSVCGPPTEAKAVAGCECWLCWLWGQIL